jgi:hypothetical protein
MKANEQVIETMKRLPPDKQWEVVDFAEFLERKCAPMRSRRSVRGLWSDLHFDVTEADIAEARAENKWNG